MTDERRREEAAPIIAAFERTPHVLLREVAQSHGLTVRDLRGDRRSAPYVRARREAIVAIKAAFPAISLPRIGSLMGRDHTTILHHLRKAGVR